MSDKFRVVNIGNLTLYYSYDTVIAFRDNGVLTITKNEWGHTTGKHLNHVDSDKNNRIPYKEFQREFETMLYNHKLI